MIRLMFLAAAIVATMLSGTASAGPFRRAVIRTTSTVCESDGCGATSTATTRSVTRGHTGSAQGVAELQAQAGACRHYGGNQSYEGVGVGGSPQSALDACCNNGGAIVDQGVAQGRDGRWYACRRYSQR